MYIESRKHINASKEINVSEIKEYLHGLLNKETSKEVLQLDEEFKRLESTKARPFMEKFEVKNRGNDLNLFDSLEDVKSEKDPVLLVQWSKYRLMKLQLSYLANQRATLNQIKQQKEDGLKNLQNYQKSFNLESIVQNIQNHKNEKQDLPNIQDKKVGEEFKFDPVPYNKFLEELRRYQEKMSFASEEEEEKPTEISINFENIPKKNNEPIVQEKSMQQPVPFKEFRERMLSSSKPEFPIIPVTSGVESIVKDAVEHGIPLEKFITTLGAVFLQTVNTEHPTDPLTNEYRKIFMLIGAEMEKSEPSEEVIQKYIKELQNTDSIPPKKRDVKEEVNKTFDYLSRLYDSIPVFVKEIRRVCQDYYGYEEFSKNEDFFWQQVSTMFGDASWAGFDADGNDEVDFKATSNAIAEHHKRVVEKHTAALKQIKKYCKNKERPLRKQIFNDQMNFYHSNKEQFNKEQDEKIFSYCTRSGNYIDERDFISLIELYTDQIEYIKEQFKENSSEFLKITEELLEKTKRLQQIAELAGVYKAEGMKNEAPVKGSIHHFIKLMEKHRDIIRNDTDNIQLKQKENGTGKLASVAVIDEYNELMKKHEQLFGQDPELKLKMRCFGVQLKSFGMTYGKGHARQNSAVYAVWNTIIEDLKLDEEAKKIPCIEKLCNDTYKKLAQEKRAEFHRQLRKSPKLLEIILRKLRIPAKSIGHSS